MKSGRFALAAGLIIAVAALTTRPAAFAVTAKKKIRKVRTRKSPLRSRPELIARITDRLRNSPTALADPAALKPFFERLSAGGQLSILQYGDSHTAADLWTGELRRLFQAKFGDGGAGFSHAGRPWNSYRREDVRSSTSKRWYTDGLAGRSGDGKYGLAGVSINAKRPGEWVSLEASGPVLQVWYLQQPEGGSLEITDGGQPVETISTAGEAGPGYYQHQAPNRRHEYLLRTTDRAPVRLFGWVTGNSHGLTYEMLGINGAQASMILDWDQHLLTDQIRHRNPALIVLAYGTNEAGNRSLTEQAYCELLKSVIGRMRAATPEAAILVIGPPDRALRRGRKWLPYLPVDRIIAAQRSATAQAGCAFYNLRVKMGDTGIMHEWVLAGLAQPDHVHLTGAGYRLIAQALYADVIAQYDVFRKAQGEKSSPVPAPPD